MANNGLAGHTVSASYKLDIVGLANHSGIVSASYEQDSAVVHGLANTAKDRKLYL